jgi:GxxExxY protein
MDVFDFRERAGVGVDERTEALAKAVIGAAIEVHRQLKPGRPENAYKLALCHELRLRGIETECEVPLPIVYKGIEVGKSFIDVLVERCLVLELKAVDRLTDVHQAQIIGYLQGSGLTLGLLINFNVILLRDGIKRVINTYRT